VVKIVLEQSPSNALLLYAKAIDLWNRILECGRKDNMVYGEPADRQAIKCWIDKHRDIAENPEVSARYDINVSQLTGCRRSKKVELQLRKLWREQKDLLRQANGKQLLCLETDLKEAAEEQPARPNRGPGREDNEGPLALVPHSHRDLETFDLSAENRLEVLRHLRRTGITGNEVNLLAELMPVVQSRMGSGRDPNLRIPSPIVGHRSHESMVEQLPEHSGIHDGANLVTPTDLENESQELASRTGTPFATGDASEFPWPYRPAHRADSMPGAVLENSSIGSIHDYNDCNITLSQLLI
jgi:hypothetical protein